jgi:hypothetical protein
MWPLIKAKSKKWMWHFWEVLREGSKRDAWGAEDGLIAMIATALSKERLSAYLTGTYHFFGMGSAIGDSPASSRWHWTATWIYTYTWHVYLRATLQADNALTQHCTHDAQPLCLVKTVPRLDSRCLLLRMHCTVLWHFNCNDAVFSQQTVIQLHFLSQCNCEMKALKSCNLQLPQQQSVEHQHGTWM